MAIMDFDEGSSSSEEDDRQRYIKLKAAASKRTPQVVNESLYMYDEVYDSMKDLEIGNKRSHQSSSQYISNLLSAKSQRESDKSSIRDQKLRLELEKDKHLYQGKEVFVTSSYRAAQAEQLKSAIQLNDKEINEPTLLQRLQNEEELKHLRVLGLLGVDIVKGESETHRDNLTFETELPAGLNIIPSEKEPHQVVRQNVRIHISKPKPLKRPNGNSPYTDEILVDQRLIKAEKFAELLRSTEIPEEELLKYEERYHERIKHRHKSDIKKI